VNSFGSVHSSPRYSSKFALHWVPLATALNGCRQTGSSTLHAHHVGTYRPYESDYPGASNISVMDGTAFTAPFAYLQRTLGPYVPAIRAYARRPLPWVYLKHIAAMPVRLVSDLAGELAQAYIADRTRKCVVSKHSLYVVRLDRQRLVLANQLTTPLVQEILACVRHASVQASYPKPLPSASIRPFSLSGQPPLRPPQILSPLLDRAGVAGLVAVTCDNNILHAEVDANEGAFLRQGLNFNLADKRDKVRPVHLSLVKLIAHRLRRAFLFKLGRLGAARKEVLEGMLLVTQHLGQDRASGLTEPGTFPTFKFGDLAGNINARQALTVLLVRSGAALKRMIPDVPRTAEVLCKLLLLGRIWIKAEFVGLANHGAILEYSPEKCGDRVHSLRYPSFCANFKDFLFQHASVAKVGLLPLGLVILFVLLLIALI
jgi:hypothetical protein